MLSTYKPVLQIRMQILADPHHLAGSGSRSGILYADPDPADQDADPRLQDWHFVNLFSVETYCE
jgi:hypothetical protein